MFRDRRCANRDSRRRDRTASPPRRALEVATSSEEPAPVALAGFEECRASLPRRVVAVCVAAEPPVAGRREPEDAREAMALDIEPAKRGDAGIRFRPVAVLDDEPLGFEPGEFGGVQDREPTVIGKDADLRITPRARAVALCDGDE